MSMSDRQPRRGAVLLWLAGFVVVFGGASWIVTGGISRDTPPALESHTITSSPMPTLGPTPPFCASFQLELNGAFSDCTSIDRTSVDNCAVSTHAFYAVFKLRGTRHDFLLRLNIPFTYPEPGDYNLANGGAEVDVSDDATGEYWTSASGVLTTTASDDRSGSVSAVLEASAGNNSVVPGPTLRVDGPWRC
jgi:hypothetical protein